MARYLLLALLLCATACAPAATATPTAAPGQDGVVVTFRVLEGEDAEEYKLRLTDPADIEIARALLAGEEAPRIPNGRVVRGEAEVNEGYSWHIDPNDIDFADVAMEICDGRPSDVEQEIITSDRYCPWAATVIAIDE